MSILTTLFPGKLYCFQEFPRVHILGQFCLICLFVLPCLLKIHFSSCLQNLKICKTIFSVLDCSLPQQVNAFFELMCLNSCISNVKNCITFARILNLIENVNNINDRTLFRVRKLPTLVYGFIAYCYLLTIEECLHNVLTRTWVSFVDLVKISILLFPIYNSLVISIKKSY